MVLKASVHTLDSSIVLGRVRRRVHHAHTFVEAVVEEGTRKLGAPVTDDLARAADIGDEMLERTAGLGLAPQDTHINIIGGRVDKHAHVYTTSEGRYFIRPDEIDRDLAQDGIGLQTRRLVLIRTRAR